MIAAGSNKGNVFLWDGQTLELIATIPVGGSRWVERLQRVGLLLALVGWGVVWFVYCRRDHRVGEPRSSGTVEEEAVHAEG